MKVENQVHPTPENVRAFLASEGPVCMVNLLKFKEKAEYPDGRDADLPGRDAYYRYAMEMKKLVEGSGGRFIFGGIVLNALLGEIEEPWDEVGIVEYPSARALVEIASTPAFREIDVHRTAGLAGQLNITTRETELGD
ncbi:MAG: DUF1330 domain-containing protein [Myxococcota bacterium]